LGPVETKKGEVESEEEVELEGEAAILFANFELGTKTAGRAETDSDRAMIVTSDEIR